MIFFISLVIGLAFGSFANVCISRMPADESVVTPRSKCPQCLKPIAARDNIPLLSYCFLRGKCRQCSFPISWLYPAVEGLMALGFIANAMVFKADWVRLVFTDFLLFYLFTISVIDYFHRIIPDELSLSLLGLGLLTAYVNPFLRHSGFGGATESLCAALLGCLGMLFVAWAGEKAFKKEALGGGDIKLVSAFGAYLGWDGLLSSLLFGSMLGGLVGVTLIVIGKKKKGETLPFGPFLSIGAYAVCFLPSEWLRLIFP